MPSFPSIPSTVEENFEIRKIDIQAYYVIEIGHIPQEASLVQAVHYQEYPSQFQFDLVVDKEASHYTFPVDESSLVLP